MSFELAEFQIFGSESLRKKKRLILGDDPGLGKTVQAIDAWEKIDPETTLIVVPNSLKLRWRDGFLDQLGWSDLNIVRGDAKQRVKLIKKESLITVISYDTLRSDIKTLLTKKYRCIIMDEAHKLKNRQAKVTNAAFSLAKHNAYSYLWPLTGTPILGTTQDIWPLLHMLDHYKFRGYWPWIDKHFHTQMISYGVSNFPVRQVGKVRDVEALVKELEPYILRRTKDQVDFFDHAERLPDTIYSVDLHPEQRRIYDKMRKDWIYKHKGDEDKATIALNGMSVQLRLRQICISESLLDPNAILITPGAKFDVLDELLAETDARFFIVSSFRGTLEVIKDRYKSVTLLHGNIPEHERSDLVKQFNKSDHRIFAGTIRTVAEGLDGLQYSCSNLVFMDRDWIPKINDQVIGRLDRKGQTEPVRVCSILGERTVEQKIYRNIEAKRKAGFFIDPISMEELYELLSED